MSSAVSAGWRWFSRPQPVMACLRCELLRTARRPVAGPSVEPGRRHDDVPDALIDRMTIQSGTGIQPDLDLHQHGVSISGYVQGDIR